MRTPAPRPADSPAARPVTGSGRRLVGPSAGAALIALALAGLPGRAAAQTPERGRAAIESLPVPPLDFAPPEVVRSDVDGVPLLVLPDRTLPLITVHAYFEGGYGLFGRGRYASAMGLPSLLRYGGTVDLTPDSVDVVLERLAIQTSFGSAGGSVSASVNALTEDIDVAVRLWGDLLVEPGFDADEIEIWRGRQLESVLRRVDDPGRLAFSEFNRLLFGDHPIGWEMEPADLEPERVTAERFREIHARVICRDNLVLGMTGDVGPGDAERIARGFVGRVEPCVRELPEPPRPEIRRGGGVYVIERDLEQAVIVMAHPTSVHLGDDPEYFSAMIGNSILGAGGFSSRILARVRTQEGFAYGANSLWTTPRENDGIVGAVTRTSPQNAVAAIRVILDAMSEMRAQAPSPEELRTAVDQVVNGYVFNFQTPDQIVSRAMSFLAQELPEDWVERYLRGVQDVTTGSVRNVFAEHLRPEAMTILVVGDPERIGLEALRALGPVTFLDIR